MIDNINRKEILLAQAEKKHNQEVKDEYNKLFEHLLPLRDKSIEYYMHRCINQKDFYKEIEGLKFFIKDLNIWFSDPDPKETLKSLHALQPS